MFFTGVRRAVSLFIFPPSHLSVSWCYMGCGELLGSGHIFLFEIPKALQTKQIASKVFQREGARCMFKSRFSGSGGSPQVLFQSLIYQLRRSRFGANGSWVSHLAECNFIQQWFITAAHVTHWLTWTNLHVPKLQTTLLHVFLVFGI